MISLPRKEYTNADVKERSFIINNYKEDVKFLKATADFYNVGIYKLLERYVNILETDYAKLCLKKSGLKIKKQQIQELGKAVEYNIPYLIEKNQEFIEQVLKPKINKERYEKKTDPDALMRLENIEVVLESYKEINGMLEYFINLCNLASTKLTSAKTPRMPIVKDFLMEATVYGKSALVYLKKLNHHIHEVEKLISENKLSEKGRSIAEPRLELERFLALLLKETINFIETLYKGCQNFDKMYDYTFNPMDDEMKDCLEIHFIKPMKKIQELNDAVFDECNYFARGSTICDIFASFQTFVDGLFCKGLMLTDTHFVRIFENMNLLSTEGDEMAELFSNVWDILSKNEDMDELFEELQEVHSLKASLRFAFRNIFKDLAYLKNLFADIKFADTMQSRNYVTMHFEAYERFEIILAKKKTDGIIFDEMVEQLIELMKNQHPKYIKMVEAFLVKYCDYHIQE